MTKRIIHTPEGVRDIYPLECRQKLALQNQLHRTLKSYGYQDIQTPTLEFSDVFSKEVGSLDSKELYRFFDRDGEILVLRPDITPSIARAISTIFDGDVSFGKYCYTGNTFINHNSYQGRLKENTQLGAEMIGLNSIDSDTEMIAIVSDVLQAAGLEEYQISLSHVAYYNTLIEEAHLSSDTEDQIRELCENKNYYAISEVLSSCSIDDKIRKAFEILPELVGGVEILAKAKEYAPSQKAEEAIERLESISKVLEMYGALSHVTFDLSMIGTYGYYTGIVFKAYTFGSGDAIVKGGRYDNLMKHFGKDVPAIGFAIVLDELFIALLRQKLEIRCDRDTHIILYDDSMQEKAIRLAKNFRQNDRVTEIILKDTSKELEYYLSYGEKNYAKFVFYLGNDRVIKAYNLLDGSVEIVDTKTLK